MPEPKELLLVRHGQSTANARGIWQGQMEFPLSDEGRRQARLAGRALAGEAIDAVYSSPLARAFETAEIISRETGAPNGVTAVDGLKERHGGALQGLTWAEQRERDPDLVEKLLSMPEEEWWTVVGAETDEQVMSRFEEAIDDILGRQPAGSRFVVVSHGGSMRAFLRDRFGPDVLPDTQRAANASITRIRWNPNGSSPDLVDLASTKHLTGHSGPDTTSVE